MQSDKLAISSVAVKVFALKGAIAAGCAVLSQTKPSSLIIRTTSLDGMVSFGGLVRAVSVSPSGSPRQADRSAGIDGRIVALVMEMVVLRDWAEAPKHNKRLRKAREVAFMGLISD